MKRKVLIASMLVSTLMLAVSNMAFSDDDDNDDSLARRYGGSKPGVAPVENSQYLEECGGCHFPYQPGLLPARSWEKLMTGLEDHFAENAELPPEDIKAITAYLVKNAADHSSYRRSQRILEYMGPDDTPLRISETTYFVRKHDELSNRMVRDNPKVGSFSNCEACHSRAANGSYSEREIRIPGFGQWDDD